MAITSSTVISLVAALAADSALASLSSMASSTLYFLPPTSMPAGLLDVLQPHLGRELGGLAHLGDVAGDLGVDADLDGVVFWAMAAVTMTMLASNSTETTMIFFMPSSFGEFGLSAGKEPPEYARQVALARA